MKKIAEMSMMELGGYVCQKLKDNGIEVTLSGGSCVEIYSHGAYTSYDLDLINQYNEDFRKIRQIMSELGFAEKNRYFVREDTRYFIESPSGPLSVGDMPVHEIAEIDTEAGVLRLLTPTDCVKDRLAAYYHWNDEPSLQQAIWVARQNPINMESVKSWSEREGAQEKFDRFLEEVNKQQ